MRSCSQWWFRRICACSVPDTSLTTDPHWRPRATSWVLRATSLRATATRCSSPAPTERVMGSLLLSASQPPPLRGVHCVLVPFAVSVIVGGTSPPRSINIA